MNFKDNYCKSQVLKNSQELSLQVESIAATKHTDLSQGESASQSKDLQRSFKNPTPNTQMYIRTQKAREDKASGNIEVTLFGEFVLYNSGLDYHSIHDIA